MKQAQLDLGKKKPILLTPLRWVPLRILTWARGMSCVGHDDSAELEFNDMEKTIARRLFVSSP